MTGTRRSARLNSSNDPEVISLTDSNNNETENKKKTGKSSAKNSSSKKHQKETKPENLPDDEPCPVCYTTLKDEKSYAKIVDCTHIFCLNCIRKWSREKQEPTCPCCNIPFHFILEIKQDGSSLKRDAKTFIKAKKLKERDPSLVDLNNYNPLDGPIISDQHWEFSQRRGIYNNGYKVKKFSGEKANMRRPCDAIYFRENPGYSVRLLPFIRRELQSVVPQLSYFTLNSYERSLHEFINNQGLPKYYPNHTNIKSCTNCRLLLEIFSNNKKFIEIFCHELKAFASSAYETIEQYDVAAVYATLSDGEEIYNNAERNKENDPITLDDSIDLTSSSSANHHQNKRKINQISSTPRSRRKRQKLDENPESIEILDSPNIHHQAIPVENIQSGSTGIQSNNSSQNSFRPTRHLIRTTPFEQIINSPEIQNLANSIPANIYNNLPIIASNGISIINRGNNTIVTNRLTNEITHFANNLTTNITFNQPMPPIIENLSRASLNSHPGNVSAAGSSRSTRRSRRSEQDSEVAFVGVLQEAPIVISDNEEELNDSLEDQLPDEMVLEMSENSIDLSKLDSDIEVASHSQDSAVVEQVRENDTPISLENVETTLNLPAESTHNMTTRSRSRSSNRSISNSNSSINMNNLSILPEMTELDATVDLVEADSTQNSRPQSQNSHILYLSSDSEDEDIVDREGLFANFRNNLRRLVRRETN